VRHCLDNGHLVFATCRSPDKAGSLHRLREAHPDTLRILRLDLLDPGSHEEVRASVEAQTGAIDVLVNNAGIYIRDPRVAPEGKHRSIGRFDPEATLELFRVNAVAPLAVTRTLLPLLMKGDRPRIAFLSSGMSSIGAKDGSEIEYSYSASKAALNMFARVLAHEVAEQGILVISIDPGWVATDMGTQRAPLQPDEVARGLWQVIEGLDTSGSGSFLDWKGRPVRW